MQQTETDERWYVQFDSGQVQLMTLEELDTAFEAGEVHENTFVIQVGETEWQTLADVAGLNDEEESEEAEVIEAEPETTTLYTPAQAATLHAQTAPPMPRAPQAPVAMQAPPAAYAAPAAVPSVRPAVAVAAGGWPPVAAPAAPQSSWPPVATSRPSGGYNLGPQSMVPVVNDLDTDFGTPSFKSGRRNALIAAFAAIALIGGGGYALTRLDMPPERPAVAAAAPVAPQTSNPWKPPAPTSAPAAAPTPTPTPTPSETKSESASTGRLSDDMKKALLASDSNRAASKAKAKAAAPARRSGGSGKQSSSGVFKSGGSANDPLNSKL